MQHNCNFALGIYRCQASIYMQNDEVQKLQIYIQEYSPTLTGKSVLVYIQEVFDDEEAYHARVNMQNYVRTCLARELFYGATDKAA